MRAIDRLGDREMRATAQICARLGERATRAIESALGDEAPLARHLRDIDSLAREKNATRREDRMRALAERLESDRAELASDNGRLGQEERALFIQIAALRRYASLAERIEELLEDAGNSNPDVLYTLRQRRRELLLQLAIASQTYASVRLIEQRNLDVIWGLRSATATTLTVLRASALTRLVEDIEDRRRRTLSQIRSGGEQR